MSQTRRALVDKIPTDGKWIELSNFESDHLTKVLRLGQGATVEAIDGAGSGLLCTLKFDGKKTFLVAGGPEGLRRASEQETLPITLAACISKADAMEWIIEKSCELGVASIQPLFSDFSVVQANKGKTPEDFRDRWKKIADQSLKQCGRLTRLQVGLPIPLSQYVIPSYYFELDTEIGLLAKLQTDKPSKLSIITGPEGGFSDLEKTILARTHTRVGLGPLTLRAETAAVAAASIASEWFRTFS